MNKIDIDKIVYREYMPGDEEQIVNLINNCFGLHRDLEWWNWFYRQNPIGAPIQYVAEYEGRIISQRSLVPFKYTCNGHEIIAGQACDSSTDPRFRRLGIFSKLLKLALDEAKKRNWKFSYGFPGPMSYPGYIKSGWTDVCRISRLVKIINHKRVFEELIKERKIRFCRIILSALYVFYMKIISHFKIPSEENYINCKIIEVDLFDIEVNKICSRESKEVCESYKNDVFLNWRYNSKDRNYKKFLVINNEKVEGYFVLKVGEKYGFNTGFVLDIQLKESKILGPYVIRCIQDYFEKEKVDIITLWTNSIANKVWYKKGFLKSPIYKTKLVQIVLNNYETSNHYLFQLGDTDAY